MRNPINTFNHEGDWLMSASDILDSIHVGITAQTFAERVTGTVARSKRHWYERSDWSDARPASSMMETRKWVRR